LRDKRTEKFGFDAVVWRWFERRFGEPSHIQKIGWPVIAAADDPPGHDVLLCAPTGSGKTLAAFMWAIDRIVAQQRITELADEISVVYVSPLKALANDIRINLSEPLEGIRQEAAAVESGAPMAEIRVGLRTGDTPVHERAAMLKRPPHILVTTPESLFNLMGSPRFSQRLASVRCVIVDELHAIAPNKRGAHLAITLERLEHLVRERGGRRPVRIGLSATLNPIERMGEFLAGFDVDAAGRRTPRPVRIVQAQGDARAPDLAIVAPGPELGPIATHQHWDAAYDELARLIGEHRTTLVFTLSRRLAERTALNLQHRLGVDAVMAHHGSLARRERLEAEQRLKHGELKALVATASLELGIDVGTVDLVCQIDSPRSISAAVQRVGRSGHRLDAIPKGRFFALTMDDLIESAAAVRAIRVGLLDEVEIPGGCLDVAAQQIVAIAAGRQNISQNNSEDDISEDDLSRLLRGAYNFGALDGPGLSTLLTDMAAELPERIRGAAPKIFHDRRNRRVRARRAARLSALLSGGTIPENGNYDVVIASEGRKVGDVEEDFAQESVRGDVFALGSSPWRILGTSRNRLLVEAAPGMAPSVPFWLNEANGRSPALSTTVTALRREIAARIAAGGIEDAAAWLMRECALDDRAAHAAAEYIRRGVAALGVVPDERTIVIERFFDGLGGTQIVIHSPFGIRLNRGFGLALRKRLCQSFDFEIQASAIDDAVLLALNSRHSFALDHVTAMLPSRKLADVLTQALLDAPMFETRFRHVASRALAVQRAETGRRVPAWIQRLRSQELMASLFPAHQACFENRPPHIDLPAHFIVGETMRECLTESTDLPRLQKLVEGIERGDIRVVTVDSIAPSVFAHRILLAWDYSFLDDGERANRRSRTVQLNRAMAEDVMRTEDISDLLERDAIEVVEAEVAGTATVARARNRDELLELVRRHGAIPVASLAERVNGDAAAMAAALEGEGRLTRVTLDPARAASVIVSDDCALFSAAYPSVVFGNDELLIDQPVPESDVAREEIIRRAMGTSGPVTIGELAKRLGFTAIEIERALVQLEAKGTVFRGRFARRPGGEIADWCYRYNLERIHRVTLARLRSQVEPASDEDYARFRLRWNHVGGIGLEPGTDAVAAALDCLAGVGFEPDFWERSILPARATGYRPEMLDRLCSGGEFTWLAVPTEATGGFPAGFPNRVAIYRRRAVPAQSIDASAITDPNQRVVFEALAGRGASYLDEIADRANLSERDALRALWGLAAAGLVSNDSFAPLRMLHAEPAAVRDTPAVHSRSRSNGSIKHNAAVRARMGSTAAGRWSVPAAPRDNDLINDDPAHAAAIALLERNGIVAREMIALETSDIRWSDVVFALRRMEYAGSIRRGYFVRTLSGEQYAIPDALQMLTSIRTIAPAREPAIALSAADPANPYGAILPACGIARDKDNLIVFRAGVPLAGLAATALRTIGEPSADEMTVAVTALIATRPRLTIERIDDIPALESEWVDVMASIGFHSDGRALVFDGLPGPRPARARRASA